MPDEPDQRDSSASPSNSSTSSYLGRSPYDLGSDPTTDKQLTRAILEGVNHKPSDLVLRAGRDSSTGQITSQLTVGNENRDRPVRYDTAPHGWHAPVSELLRAEGSRFPDASTNANAQLAVDSSAAAETQAARDLTTIGFGTPEQTRRENRQNPSPENSDAAHRAVEAALAVRQAKTRYRQAVTTASTEHSANAPVAQAALAPSGKRARSDSNSADGARPNPAHRPPSPSAGPAR